MREEILKENQEIKHFNISLLGVLYQKVVLSINMFLVKEDKTYN